MKRITIFDYGAGNLHSLAKVLASANTGWTNTNVDVRIEPDPVAALDTDLLVLPGVGAFTHAAERLRLGCEAVRTAILSGLPTLGICLGMQLLFTNSEEGPGDGLDVIVGSVRKLRSRRVPQIGWNEVTPVKEREYTSESAPRHTADGFSLWPNSHMMYFANSYVCEPRDASVIHATTTHESDQFASVVAIHRTVGVQFHPEKSSTAGVAFVHNFVRDVIQ